MATDSRLTRARRAAALLCAVAAADSGLACSDCTYRDFAVGSIAAYFDPTLSNEARLEVAGSGSSPPLTLAIENYPSLPDSMALGQSGSVPLDDGLNTDLTACGLCVVASRGAAIYGPLRGSAQLSAPQATGDAFDVTLEGVALQRVDPLSGAPLDDGHRWCLRSGTRLAAATTPWPCSAIATLLPGASLAAGQSVCAATPDLGSYVLWTCVGGQITRGDDCAALGKVCDPAANAAGAAACG